MKGINMLTKEIRKTLSTISCLKNILLILRGTILILLLLAVIMLFVNQSSNMIYMNQSIALIIIESIVFLIFSWIVCYFIQEKRRELKYLLDYEFSLIKY